MSAVKKKPARRCVGCGEMIEKSQLIRVLKTPEGQICLDRTGRKNGRGAYLCAREQCLALARKNRGLERSLKTPVAPEIYEQLQEEMKLVREQ